MSKLKLVIITLALIISSGQLMAVGGLSATKLLVPSADTLEPGTMDFEVAFGYSRHRSYFDEWGRKKNYPEGYDPYDQNAVKEVEAESTLDFRMTAGILPQFEIGFGFGNSVAQNSVTGNTSSGYSDLAVGVKYTLNPDSAFRVAFQGGVNMEAVNWIPTYEGGLIATIEITKKLSIDMDVAYSVASPRMEDGERIQPRGVAGNIGIGYEIGDLMPVVELGYSDSYYYTRRSPTVGRLEVDMPFYDFSQHPTADELLNAQEPMNIKERVKVWERSLVLTAGFTYGINDIAGVALMVSRPISGVNSDTGSTISGVFTLTFGS